MWKAKRWIEGATVTLMTRAALFACLSLLAACESGAASAADWLGTYVYEDSAGETGGVTAVVEYRLEIGKGTCRLTIQGFQADEAIVCTETVDANAMTVRFKQYQNGQLVNAFGTQVYQPNQALFSIVLSNGAALTTRWAGLKPDSTEATSGTFFKKTG